MYLSRLFLLLSPASHSWLHALLPERFCCQEEPSDHGWHFHGWHFHDWRLADMWIITKYRLWKKWWEAQSQSRQTGPRSHFRAAPFDTNTTVCYSCALPNIWHNCHDNFDVPLATKDNKPTLSCQPTTALSLTFHPTGQPLHPPVLCLHHFILFPLLCEHT